MNDGLIALGITAHEGKLALCECDTLPAWDWLRWRAGKVVNETRSYKGAGMVTRFHGTVSLFRVLGYGATKEEAIEMARKRK